MEESYCGAWKTFVFYEYGSARIGDSLDLLDQLETDSIDLVIASPPFALQREYQSKRPVRSLYNYHILIRLCEELDFRLAEEFFRPSGRLYEKTAASLLTIECSYADM